MQFPCLNRSKADWQTSDTLVVRAESHASDEPVTYFMTGISILISIEMFLRSNTCVSFNLHAFARRLWTNMHVPARATPQTHHLVHPQYSWRYNIADPYENLLQCILLELLYGYAELRSSTTRSPTVQTRKFLSATFDLQAMELLDARNDEYSNRYVLTIPGPRPGTSSKVFVTDVLWKFQTRK